ncbi:MAG TPA: hypothetical protein VFH61_07765 [Thermoleophilia bacterium]|nr:hypothetical protein [Thermoleophilia bacterium]
MSEILMEADRLLIAYKHPIIDQVRGQILGFKQGKVKPGERFTFRGELSRAPSAAHALDPEVQADIVAAKAAAVEAKEMAALAKVAKGAAMAAAAAASIFQGVPVPAPAPVAATPAAKPHKGWPKGKARGPRNKPEVKSEPALSPVPDES